MAYTRHAIAFLILCGATSAGAATPFDDAGPALAPTVPEFPQPGSGFGLTGPKVALPATPGTVQAPPPVETPAPSASEQRRRRLDELYGRLAVAKDQIEAQAIGDLIRGELLRSGSDTADLLMQRALVAVSAKRYATATDLLDKIISLRPHWAEAWNERATVRYLGDDDVGAMADIGQVLALEPRHFGALSGMGIILHRNGDDKDALTVLRRAAAINPQDGEVKTFIETLTPGVEGHEI